MHKIKQILRYYLSQRKVQYILLFTFAFLGSMLFINPIIGATPFQKRPDNVQTFQNENMAMFVKLKINATIPEADVLYDNNSLGWQIIDVMYTQKETLSPVKISLDAQEETFFTGLDEEIIQFQDKFLWEIAPFSFVGKPFLLSPNVTNIHFIEQFKNEVYQDSPASAKPIESLAILTQKFSGYKYSTALPSPAQLAVLYCNSVGYVFHDILDASTQYITGTGGIRPAYINEYRVQPCEVDYNVSLANGIINLIPMNLTEEADQAILGLLTPFMKSYEMLFDPIGISNSSNPDAFATLAIVAGVCIVALVAGAACYITDWVCRSLNLDGERQLAEAYLKWSLLSGEAYTRGRNDAANDFQDTLLDLIINDPVLSELLGNNSDIVLNRLRTLISQVNSIVKTNYTNPYLFSTGAYDLYQPSLVEIVVIVIAVTLGIIFFALLIYFIARKIRGKKGNDDKSNGQGQNIAVIQAPKTNAFNSIRNIFFFGMSTGAI